MKLTTINRNLSNLFCNFHKNATTLVSVDSKPINPQIIKIIKTFGLEKKKNHTKSIKGNYLHLFLCNSLCHVLGVVSGSRDEYKATKRLLNLINHIIFARACGRGLDLMIDSSLCLFAITCGRGLDLVIVSSLCLISSESLHGFCHFHLNCSSHW